MCFMIKYKINRLRSFKPTGRSIAEIMNWKLKSLFLNLHNRRAVGKKIRKLPEIKLIDELKKCRKFETVFTVNFKGNHSKSKVSNFKFIQDSKLKIEWPVERWK